jgi:hypothetical protein
MAVSTARFARAAIGYLRISFRFLRRGVSISDGAVTKSVAARVCGPVVCAFLLTLTNCGADLNPGAGNDPLHTASLSTELPRLQAGEKIRVTVYGEASLSGDYQIDPEGFITLPLMGTVKAAGYTRSELEIELAKDLKGEYLRNPKVTVSVIEFRPLYILGEVEKPGAYPYSVGLDPMSVIALAGGPTYRASRSTILVRHPGESAMREYPQTSMIAIMPGDIIKVPQRYF